MPPIRIPIAQGDIPPTFANPDKTFLLGNMGILSPEEALPLLLQIQQNSYFTNTQRNELLMDEFRIVSEQNERIKRQIALNKIIASISPESSTYNPNTKIAIINGGDRYQYSQTLEQLAVNKCLNIVTIPSNVLAHDENQAIGHPNQLWYVVLFVE